MGFLDRVELGEITGCEVDLLTERVKQFAERITEHDRSKPTIYDWAYEEERASIFATFAIEASDFMDSVDHATTDTLGGTADIQTFLQENRVAARSLVIKIGEKL